MNGSKITLDPPRLSQSIRFTSIHHSFPRTCRKNLNDVFMRWKLRGPRTQTGKLAKLGSGLRFAIPHLETIGRPTISIHIHPVPASSHHSAKSLGFKERKTMGLDASVAWQVASATNGSSSALKID